MQLLLVSVFECSLCKPARKWIHVNETMIRVAVYVARNLVEENHQGERALKMGKGE